MAVNFTWYTSGKSCFQRTTMKVSILVPVYNEEETINKVIGVLGNLPLDKEVIIINDGSTDRTGEILAENIKIPLNYIKGKVDLPKDIFELCPICRRKELKDQIGQITIKNRSSVCQR